MSAQRKIFHVRGATLLARALAAAVAGDVILLMPGVHTIAAGITIPAGVALEGISRTASILALAAGGDATLVAGPGATRTDTFTIRKNGVDTALVTSLTGAATDCSERGISVAFAPGDRVSLKGVITAGSGLSDVLFTAEAY